MSDPMPMPIEEYCAQLVMKIGQLQAELAQAVDHARIGWERAAEWKADAQRYRWLKEQRPQPMWGAIPMRLTMKYSGGDDENAIDKAIDEARDDAKA